MKWTGEEVEILKRLWMCPKVSNEDLLRVFPYRSWESIDSYARKRLRLPSRWRILERNINREYLKKLLDVVEG